MGNEDITIFDGIAHLKIIDVSCPQQLLSIMKWIMDGNKGLIYLRIMRAGSKAIYGPEFSFDYGKGYIIKESAGDSAVIISSGRGAHEALAAAAELEKEGLRVKVADMPSIDRKMLVDLYDSGLPVIIAEQNNGYIWRNMKKVLFEQKQTICTDRLIPVNTLDSDGNPRFIHSGTYAQLTDLCGLSFAQLAGLVRRKTAKG